MSNNTESIYKPCEHVVKYRKESGVVSYEILHAFYVSCIAKDSWKRKARDCFCNFESCKTRCQRVHACLSCIYFGCYNQYGHIHQHARDKDHMLAVDTNYGHVYCFICRDYQYDDEFEKIAQNHRLVAGRRRGLPLRWEPSAQDIALLKKHEVINVTRNIALRGIVNMGNTCYISVILQSLVHAPLFRDYFLSLQHKCSFQKSPIESQEEVSCSPPHPNCFACEISDIVQEFFSGKQEPFVPNRLLHLLWTRESDFKGYNQQDAHEFLFKLLNNLHLNIIGVSKEKEPLTESSENASDSVPCKCIIDTIFTGNRKLVYTCTKCHNKKLQTDQFKDITVLLPLPNNVNASQTSSNGAVGSTLVEYLRKNMTYIANIPCEICASDQDFHVNVSLQKLPLVISFHVNLQQDKKDIISFPEYLDMTPLTLINKDEKLPNGQRASSNNNYYLFAVVERRTKDGNTEIGHFLCYVRRHKKHWFECNDGSTKIVSIDEVLKIKPYLLFYHKEILEYE